MKGFLSFCPFHSHLATLQRLYESNLSRLSSHEYQRTFLCGHSKNTMNRTVVRYILSLFKKAQTKRQVISLCMEQKVHIIQRYEKIAPNRPTLTHRNRLRIFFFAVVVNKTLFIIQICSPKKRRKINERELGRIMSV